MEIKYVEGDATAPGEAGNKIIVHVCNDVGGWGKGFVMAISQRWKAPEEEYRKWFRSKLDFALGEVQFVQVEADLWVANLIGQRDIKKDAEGNPPVRYGAINTGIAKVGAFARAKNASVHMPRIGCGLAGGKWENIVPAISHELVGMGVPTTVYDFKP